MASKAPSYQDLLKKARADLPEELTHESRWSLPDPDIQYEGRTTILRNFTDILESTRREPTHLLPFLLREIGTGGDQEGPRVVFQGKVDEKRIEKALRDYVTMYVMCPECHRPDTHLEKDGRTTLLKCEACGAHKPVKARKARPAAPPEPAVKENETYEVMIEGTGSRGDGVARVDKYTIYVSGAQKGQQVKILVEKVTGTMAFAKVVPQ